MPPYRFDAPPGHTLLVGDDVYRPGAELELPAGQVDPRLTLIGEPGEDDNPDSSTDTATETTEPEDESETPDEPEASGLLGRSEPESAPKPTDPPVGFGNPRPAERKSGK